MDTVPTLPDGSHPLTGKFINLVVEGETPFQAAMSLVGPQLSREAAQMQCARWEKDADVQYRIHQAKQKAEKIRSNIRARVVDRVISMAFSDIRNYFTPEGPKPIQDWTAEEGQAVKKVKFRETTDPFGNVTRTFDLEFYDVQKAIGVLATLFPEKLAELKNVAINRKELANMSTEEIKEEMKRLLQ